MICFKIKILFKLLIFILSFSKGTHVYLFPQKSNFSIYPKKKKLETLSGSEQYHEKNSLKHVYKRKPCYLSYSKWEFNISGKLWKMNDVYRVLKH